jgi:predicted O-methyltransferase YrrM
MAVQSEAGPLTASAPAAGSGGFDDAWSAVSPIEGWLSKEQASVLYEVAAAVTADGWIVELGSWHGKSTVLLAKAKSRTVRLLAVDPFFERPHGGGEAAYRSFCTNVRTAGLDAKIHLFRGTSEQAAAACNLLFEAVAGEAASRMGAEGRMESANGMAPRQIGLLYIDAAHDRTSVLTDIDRWRPFVAEGGYVCFHDAFFRIGVTLAVLERHVMNTRFRYLGSAGSLAVFRCARQVSTRTSVADTLRLVGRLGYFARNMLITPAVRRNWRPLLWLIPPEDSCQY